MNVLVVGGTRFIGPRVVGRLVALGHRVAVFHRGEHRCALPTPVRDNADLATVYGARSHPAWRWIHGHVDNVASAIVLASTHEDAHGVYNVGEQYTPTVAERLAYLPVRAAASVLPGGGRFDQNIDYDTSRIRRELGYQEVIPEREGMAMVVRQFLEKIRRASTS